MNFAIALTAHALVGAFIGSHYDQTVVGIASACGAFFATTLLWIVIPETDEETP